MNFREIREAVTNEAHELSKLAYESKSYWNYDREYLEKAREHMIITEKEIINDLIFVAENGQDIVGFYHFTKSQDESELKWFFVHPRSIGQGLGQILWNHLLKTIKYHKIDRFVIKSDPNAEAFYIKRGALRIGIQSSIVDEKIKLPILKYMVK